MSDLIRLLVCSDWHADVSTGGFDRFEDVEGAVAETVVAAVAERCTHYLFLGDLCDPDTSRAHRAVALALRTALAMHRAGVASRWVVGNHDVIEDGRGGHVLAALADLAGAGVDCQVYDRPRVVPLGPAALVVLPYTARSHAYDPEAYVREAGRALRLLPEARAIVAGHLVVSGATPGSETEEMPRGREVVFPVDACREEFGDRALLLNGHYHRAQEVAGVHVPGSLERLTFGEAGHAPGYLVLEVGGA